MTGIQVHTSAPINSNTEATPQAQQPDNVSTSTGVQRPPTNPPTTHNEQFTSVAATGIPSESAPNPTRTIPPPPSQLYQPPPPQPGQTAVASTPGLYTGSTSEPAPVPAPAQPQSQPVPGNLPPLLPGQSTVRQDLSHPPGYQQQTTSFQDRPVIEEQSGSSLFNPSSVTRGVSLLDTGTSHNNDSFADQSPIWDTAKSWAKAAGDKLSTTEAQVWKMVNGDK